MKNIAEYLRKLQEKEMFDRIEVAEEMEILFTGDRELYESPEKKQQLLRQYTEKCAHDISGNTIVIRLDQLSRNLDEKADWMMEKTEKTAGSTDIMMIINVLWKGQKTARYV